MRFLSSEQPPPDGFPLREWLARLIININASLRSIEYMDVIPVTANTTASNNQVVICNNTTPINVTLPSNPYVGSHVTVKRRNASVVVVGTIDGTVNLTLLLINDFVHVVFDGTDWNII